MTVTGMLIWYLEGPFSKSTIFNCFRFQKSEPHVSYDCIFTVFLIFVSQIGFASIRNLMSSFGKAYDPFCTEILVSKCHIFSNKSKKSKFGTWLPDFSDSSPKICVLGPGNVLGCPRIIDLFTIFLIVYKFGLIRDKNWLYIPYRQYGISRFS